MLTNRGRVLMAAVLMLGAALHAAAAERVPVVASFSVLGDLVRQVGGERVQVQVLVGPGSDAHVYQPTPAQARTVAAARLVVSNGLGFEGWMSRFLRAAGFKGRHAVLAEGLAGPRRTGEAGVGPQGRHDHKGHRHDAAIDPHVWQNVAHAVTMSRRVAEALCAVDGAGCGEYTARAAAYGERLQALDLEIRQGWAALPEPRRKVITSHDAFGHYAAAYGVRFLAPQGVSTNAEASAQGVATLVRQVRAEGVRAMFLENIADPRLIEQIARETGVQPAGSLYSDSLSDAQGPAATYEAMMRHNTQLMLRAASRP